MFQRTVVVYSIRFRSVFNYQNYCFPVAFCLQLFILSGLMAVPEYAQAGIAKGEHHAPPYRFNGSDGTATVPTPMPDDLDPADLLAQTKYPVLDQGGSSEIKKPAEKQPTVEPITRWVPILGEQVREKGFDLPLPFGVGTNLVFMDQGIKLRNIKVGIGDPTIEVKGLSFVDARAHDRVITARLDMWLLPFVNIYGIFGYINGEAEIGLDINQIAGGLPIPLPPIIEPGKTINFNIDYNGTTFGGGMTLAGGYQNFFASVDANYTYSNIDVANSQIKAYTISPRVGLQMNPSAVPGALALWVGAMYMNYNQTVTDNIRLNELDPRLPPVQIDFKLDVENDQPWNFLFGGQWEITKRWQFMAEGGVGDRTQVLTGVSFRF
jgi:hypothetical protein